MVAEAMKGKKTSRICSINGALRMTQTILPSFALVIIALSIVFGDRVTCLIYLQCPNPLITPTV
jgi:hypothetical protein